MTDVPGTLSLSFIALVAILYSLLILGATYAEGRSRIGETRWSPVFVLRIAVGGWILLTGLLGGQGFFLDFGGVPPRVALSALLACVAFLIFAFSATVKRWLTQLPQVALIATQSFRIVVEVQLFYLARTVYLPKLMTFEGRNYDIVVGLSAPLMAIFAAKMGEAKARVALIVWNVLGLLILANTVATALFSAPTPFRKFFEEPANTAIGYFPFNWLPAFVVPFAVFLHLISLRKAVGSRRPA
jgi:hypothetical protein